MKTIFFFLAILLYACGLTSAQESKVRFGKISPADLAMKEYAPDTEAVAVVLSKVGRIKYDVLQENFSLTEQRHEVIKILKEAGVGYGNMEIRYYAYKNYSKVGEIKGLVHLPDGTQVKLDNSHIFDFKANEFWSFKRIAFPKIVPGAIIEIQYTILSNGMYKPVDFFFQDEIPIVYAELTTKIPDWFHYVILTQGQSLDKNETKETVESVSMNYVNRGASAFETSSMQRAEANVRFINSTYINKDVPGLKEECCITTMEDYFSRVRYQLKAVQFPNSPMDPVLSSWEKLAEGLYNIQEWGGQFRNKRPGELVLEAAGINPADGSTHIEIAQKLYDYVNNNIHWNELYGWGWTKDNNAILQEKSGNSGDLNKLICAGLIQSGIDAKPVLISTRHHGKPLELYPFTDQFNHLVVLARIDNKDIWIDAGDKNIPLGTLRMNALNNRGGGGYRTNPHWLDIRQHDSKLLYILNGRIDKDGLLHGTLESRFTGYDAIDQRIKLKISKDKSADELLTGGANPIKLGEVEWINLQDASLPLQFKTTITNLPVATVTPDKIYISPIFPHGQDDIPLKLEERTYPIEMEYPREISISMNLDLPEGYIVESMPVPVKYMMENGGIQVIYSASQSAGKINISMKYIVKQVHFDPSEYSNLKTLYNHRHEKFNEVIVLTKA